ncbi:hypothetical protein AB1E18_015052 [Capra hircus]
MAPNKIKYICDDVTLYFCKQNHSFLYISNFSEDSVYDFLDNRATKPEIVDKESNTDIIERAPQEQINHDRFSSVDGTHRNNRSDMTSALGLGIEEDIESPWDSESISESLPQKYVDLLAGAAGQRGKIMLNGQVEELIIYYFLNVSYIPSCMIGLRNFKMAKLEEPRHVGIQVAHMDSPEKYPNVKPAVLVREPIPNKTVGVKDLQTFTSDLSAELDLEMTSEEEEEKPVGDENNHSQFEEEKKHKSSEVAVSDNVCDTADESGLIQQGKNKQEFAAMENEGSDSDPGVHRKEVKKKDTSKWTPEECVIAPIFEKTDSLTGGLLHVNDDSILSEVDQDDDRPAKKTSNENNKVKEQINSVDDLDDLTQSSETASKDGELLYYENSTKVRGLQKELSETKEVKSQLEHQKVEWERELGSLRKKDQYSKEVEMKQQLELTLRALEMELKTVRNDLNQVSDSCEEAKDLLCKNHVLQDELAMPRLEIDAVKNQNHQQRLRPNILSQLNALTAENTMLNSKLENEKKANEDWKWNQTSKRDLEFAFQRARDEWLHLQDKMKTDVANLKDNKEMLSQQLSRVENSLREKILILECVQRDLSQTECQKQETEHTYQNEQGESENMLLRQQLDDAQNRADSKEKTVISVQDQFQQIVRKLKAKHEKQGLMLEERNKELIKECIHLKERMCQYENEKAEREAVVRQLQQELADTLRKQSISEASLEVLSRYRANLEVEAQDLKKNLCQLTSQEFSWNSELNKDLESELSKVKTLQEDSHKAELEKYKQLYLVELEVRKSLEGKLDSRDLEPSKHSGRSSFSQTHWLGATDGSNLSQDLLLKTSQEYVQILKKK